MHLVMRGRPRSWQSVTEPFSPRQLLLEIRECSQAGTQLMRQPPLILVVDDNEANVDILATRLGVQGYAVITARDGEEALQRARAERPDLILLDIMMPKIDGLEVTRRLRADGSLPFMPIILVT